MNRKENTTFKLQELKTLYLIDCLISKNYTSDFSSKFAVKIKIYVFKFHSSIARRKSLMFGSYFFVALYNGVSHHSVVLSM